MARSCADLARKLGTALVLAASLPALAERYTPGQAAYMEGQLAYQSGAYDEAERRLREALLSDRVEKLSSFRYTGLTREDYLPHFFLGLTLQRLGRNQEALNVLLESRRQGTVRGRPGLWSALSSAIATLEDLTRPTPSPPSPTPTAPQPSQTHTFPAVALPSPTWTPLIPPIPLATPRTATRTHSPRGARLVDEASLAEARAGLRQFFAGKFSESVRTLQPLTDDIPVTRFFLAYALASRYLLEGSRNEAILERAREEHAAASRARAKEPPPSLISPAVLALLKSDEPPR